MKRLIALLLLVCVPAATPADAAQVAVGRSAQTDLMVTVYKADASGSQQLIGEDWIDHTPKDERVKIKMGEAFDVVGERTQKEWRKLGAGLYEVAWEITLRNHKTTDQAVTVIEPVPGDWQVLNASHAWDKPQAHTLRFTVPVAKESAATLAYRLRLRF
jgi:hypothetical protein